MSLDLFDQIFKYILVFIAGLISGSFINCFVWRKNNNMRISVGRSQCPFCCRQLYWWENIPLFSYFFLNRRCSGCKKIIPIYYPLVEFFTGVLFLHAYYMIIRHFPGGWIFLFRELIMLSVLVIIFVSDALYKIIWPSVVWFGLFIVLVINLFLQQNPLSMLFGALVGGGFFLLQYIFSKGRWIGGGDVRMGAMMGVWLGWPLIFVALLLAYITGAVSGIALLLSRNKKLASAIAFGPYLVIATLITHYFRVEILDFMAILFNRI